MLSTKRLRIVLPVSALLIFLFGATLFWLNHSSLRPGPGEERIHVAAITESGNVLDCKWHISGDRKWVTFGRSTGPVPASLISLRPESSILHSLLYPSGTNGWDFELKVTVSRGFAPGQSTCTADIDMWRANGSAPALSSSRTFTCNAVSMKKIVVVNAAQDSVVKVPGRVLLATIDGKPIVLEFGK